MVASGCDIVSYRPCQRFACGRREPPASIANGLLQREGLLLMMPAARPDKHGLHAVIVGCSRPARNYP